MISTNPIFSGFEFHGMQLIEFIFHLFNMTLEVNDCKEDQTEIRRHSVIEQSYNSTNCNEKDVLSQ